MIYRNADARSTLYYNRYRFSVHFNFKEAYSLRYPQNKISMMLTWRYQMRYHGEIPDSIASYIPTVLAMREYLDGLDDIKIVLYQDFVYLYTNDPDIADHLEAQEYIRNVFVTEADLVKPAGVVELKNPRWAYRSYFRERYLGEERGSTLSRFLVSRKDCFGYSSTLYSRMQSEHSLRRSMSHYFVDHNDLRDIQMLDLVCPGIIRKTLPIKAK